MPTASSTFSAVDEMASSCFSVILLPTASLTLSNHVPRSGMLQVVLREIAKENMDSASECCVGGVERVDDYFGRSKSRACARASRRGLRLAQLA